MADAEFDEEFIGVLASDDTQIANAARNVNRTIASYAESFGDAAIEVPVCRALQGESDGLHVAAHLSALQRLQGVRVFELLVDFARALRRRRVLSAALSGRALLETAAAIVFAEENAAKLLAAGALGHLLDELHRWYAGGRFDWWGAPDDESARSRLNAYAADKGPTVPDERRATNVLTMIEKLDRRVHEQSSVRDVEGGAIRVVYAMLSDLCHPATGTAIVYTSPAERPGWITIHGTTNDRAVRWFFLSVGLMIAPIANIAHASLAALGEMAQRAEASS
jgi:hypothetical protein